MLEFITSGNLDYIVNVNFLCAFLPNHFVADTEYHSPYFRKRKGSAPDKLLFRFVLGLCI